MRIEEQFYKLEEVKQQINERLNDLDDTKIMGLIHWLTRSEVYQKLKEKDNQLLALDFMINVWLQEKRYANSFSMKGDIFFGINSLENVQQKYNTAKFAIFRIESDMPYEYCVAAIKNVLEYRFSAFALYRIIVLESKSKEKNIVRFARMFRDENVLVNAIGLLEKGIEGYPENTEMLLELADCWLSVQKLDKAIEYLYKIENPDETVKELITELEKVFRDESLQ